jgi:hypothetical protein
MGDVFVGADAFVRPRERSERVTTGTVPRCRVPCSPFLIPLDRIP